jgi:hypothetical protein
MLLLAAAGAMSRGIFASTGWWAIGNMSEKDFTGAAFNFNAIFDHIFCWRCSASKVFFWVRNTQNSTRCGGSRRDAAGLDPK